MKSSPLVSVFIASYNHERYIEETVQSVIGQKYDNWELIIVDDASSDRSPELLKRFAAEYPEQIKVILLEKNIGVSRAANLAVSEGRGEYLAWIGSDDRMHPDRLARQVAFLQKNKAVAAAFSRVNVIDGDGRAISLDSNIFDKEIGELRLQLLGGNFLNAPSVMVRASVWREVGEFNPELLYLQDYDFWLRLLDKHQVIRLEERLTDYRVHGKNLSICKSEDVAFATHYETAICMLNAIQRWPVEDLFPVPHGAGAKTRRAEQIRGQVNMGRLCMEIDRGMFQRPFLGTAQAYRFALNAIQIDPENELARGLMHEVYRVLGDLPRASGEGKLKLMEWHRQVSATAIVESVADSRGAREKPEVNSAEAVDELAHRRDIAYREWRLRHTLKNEDISLFEERMQTKWSKLPAVHIVLIDVHADEKLVIDSVRSVVSQLYSGWGLSVISGRQAIIPEFESEPNLEWISTDSLANELEKLIRESSADWSTFLFSGDLLEPNFLVSMLDLADTRAGVEVVYSDTGSVNDAGDYFDVKFKPEADIDLLRSSDYIGNGCLLKTATVRENISLVSLGQYSFVYGILLKIFEDGDESVFAHDASVLFHSYDENVRLENLPISISRRKDYLERHLERCGLKSDVIEGYRPGVFYVEYKHSSVPFVSIIIPTKDGLEVLEPCISTLLEKTGYRNFEVIVVDNNSSKPETLEYFDRIQRDDPRVRVVKYQKPYNYSAINNMAAGLAQGDYLVLLNNDTAVIKEDWLDRMLSLGQREDVGVVGARLLHPDTTIQHAGVVVGMTGSADHPHTGAGAESPGYMGQNLTVRGTSAVTAACLLIRKDLYFSVGALDEEDFAVLFNDVDLCLKVREKGLRVVYTPYAVLMHHGSFSLKKKKANKPDDARHRRQECLALIRKWLPVLANDPAYNRNLGLCNREVMPEDKFIQDWDMNRHDCLRIVAFSTEAWHDDRSPVKSLLSLLQSNNSLRCTYVPVHGDPGTWVPQPVELERGKPDVLLFRAPVPDLQLNSINQHSGYWCWMTSSLSRCGNVKSVAQRVSTKISACVGHWHVVTG